MALHGAAADTRTDAVGTGSTSTLSSTEELLRYTAFLALLDFSRCKYVNALEG